MIRTQRSCIRRIVAGLAAFAGGAEVRSRDAARTTGNGLSVGKIVVRRGGRRRRRGRRRIIVSQIVAERTERQDIATGNGSATARRKGWIHYRNVTRTTDHMLPVARLPAITAVRTRATWTTGRQSQLCITGNEEKLQRIRRTANRENALCGRKSVGGSARAKAIKVPDRSPGQAPTRFRIETERVPDLV